MIYRIRDIIISLLLLVILFIPFQVIIFLLSISQERVFYFQQRTGLNGKAFRLIKFSTLRDIRGDETEAENQKLRLTRIGIILRKFSLDELPQLWNVLKGEMSLVGPRPMIHKYVFIYSEEQKKRFRVKPGITGWAQVNGRNSISFTEKFKSDNWYIENRKFQLDIKILWMSFKTLFEGKNV